MAWLQCTEYLHGEKETGIKELFNLVEKNRIRNNVVNKLLWEI